MELHFRLCADDYIALQKVLLHKLQRAGGASPWQGFVYHTLQWIPVGIAAAAIIDSVQKGQAPTGLALLVAGCAAAILLIRHGMHRILWRRIRRAIESGGDPLFESQVIVLDDAGIETASESASGRYAWQSFDDVLEDNARLFLFLGITRAIVIPKNSLPKGIDHAHFARLVSGKRRLAADPAASTVTEHQNHR